MAAGMTCGATKTIDGRREPLVCTLPAGHAGDHGIHIGHRPPFIRWPREEQRWNQKA